MNTRAFRSKGNAPWASLRELVPLASFFVTVAALGRYRRTLILLAYRVYLLVKDSGPAMACQYLKEAVRLTAKWLSGHPETKAKASGSVLVKRDSRGLPSIIPPFLRSLMVERNVEVIKAVMTILSFYRVVQAPLQMKLHTITAAYSGTVPVESVFGEVRVILARFYKDVKVNIGFSWLFSVSAGPNGSHSTWWAPLDAVAMISRPTSAIAFMRIAPWYVSLYMVSLGIWFLPVAIVRFLGGRGWPILGRLHIKPEAAGKARVFAITDWWTQGLFAGLSDWISNKILKRIPQDGTHDQHAPMRRLRENWLRFGKGAWSFDLSAATDRLPVAIQEVVLAHFCGSLIASAWRALMTSRKWYLQGEAYSYGVGQPMGAKSSWSMMALTHHVLVQVSAMRVGWTRWFPHYALLGDDIVIADEAVAEAYLALITSLGVEINLGKSVVSEDGFAEFAKRYVSPNYDYSPCGPAALLTAFRRGSQLVSLFTDLRDKAFGISPHQILGMVSEILAYYPKRGVASALQALIATLSPAGPFPLPLADWIGFHRINPAGWRGWLTPGIAHAFLWTITSFNRSHRDSARQAAVERLDAFMRSWWKAAPSYPGWMMILTPGFWIYILNLQDVISKELEPYSTRSIREQTDWQGFTPEQLAALLKGPDVDWGPLAEAMDTGSRDASRWARLRDKTLRMAKSWSPDSTRPDESLVKVIQEETTKGRP